MKKECAAVLLLLLVPASLAYVSGGRSTTYGGYRACRADQFQCQSGQCIRNSQRCDTIPDCYDKSDELNCQTTCTKDQFQCNDGTCLSIDKRCNAVPDCRAGEDEENCDCNSSEFRCTDGSCIGYEFRCNDREDCADGSDEKDCVETRRDKRSVEKSDKGSRQRGKNGRKRKNEWENIGPSDYVDKRLKNLKRLSYEMENEINKTSSSSSRHVKKQKKKKSRQMNKNRKGTFPLEEHDTLSSYSSTAKSNEIFENITKNRIIETTETPVQITTNVIRPTNSTWFRSAEKVIAENVSSIPMYTVKPGSFVDKYLEKYLANQNLTRKLVSLRRDTDVRKKSAEDSKAENKFVKTKSDNQTIEIVMLKSFLNENHPVSYETVSEKSEEINCESKDCESLKMKFEKLLREFELLKKRFNRCSKSTESALMESLEGVKEKETRSDFGVEVFADVDKFQSEETVRTKGSERTTSSALDVEVFDVKNETKKSESVGPGVTTPKPKAPNSKRTFNKSRNSHKRPKKSRKTTVPIAGTEKSEPSTTPSPNSNSAESTTIEPVDSNFLQKAGKRLLCLLFGELCEDQETLPISSDQNFEIPKEDEFDHFDDSIFRGDLELFPDEDGSEHHKLENVDLSVLKETSSETDNEITMELTPKRCRPELEFACTNGNCIPEEKLCDDTIDCSDGSDENINNCGACNEGHRPCDNGVCISQAFFCDGNNDCLDDSDEKHCPNRAVPTPSPSRCRETDVTCYDNTCVPKSKVCDGVRDCPDGRDEERCPQGCKHDQFQCKNGDCIFSYQRCNGVVDCDEGSDEIDCPSPDDQDEEKGPGYNLMPGQCPHGFFRCHSDNNCVPHSARCNRIYECRDGSDERNCDGSPTNEELMLKTYPNNQTIKEREQVVFQCRDEGPLRAEVRWVRDGKPLPVGSRDNHHGRLEIPNIQISDAGRYTCEATNYTWLPNSRVHVDLRVEQHEGPPTRPPMVCQYGEATCSNGDCIPHNKVCDSKYDCTDGSDELRCSHHGCEPNQFRCDNKECVSKIWRCDGENDCKDGSDEENCAQLPIGAFCKYSQFECRSGAQCIPKSLQCDSERDCADGSDEIGCVPVSIIKPPPAMIHLNLYETFEISCIAIGVPTPEINFRRNWGHVPSKCRIQSLNGTGTLTCPEITIEDQGAYSCEGINTFGFVFAEHDTILMVDQQQEVCPSGTFNSEAKSPDECISCFCFGVTNKCMSANLFTFQLPPPLNSYQLVQVETLPQIRLIWNNTERTELVREGRDGIRVHDRYYSYPDNTYPYYVLPENYNGPQLKSYGGYLNYTLRYNGTSKMNLAPAVILMGNGLVLVRRGGQMYPNSENQESVRFFQGEWYKLDGNYENVASREDIMMALANVENILIKLKYDDAPVLETAIVKLTMDSAGSFNGQGAANFVEQCSCPTGYAGDSCERCAVGFSRQKTGSWLGRCVPESPSVCPPGHYGNPSRNIPCKECPCPLTSPSNQFASTCYLDTDGSPTCDCPVGYVGRRCQKCAEGFRGNPLNGGDRCVPIGLQCDPRGSYSSSPDHTGTCQCKEHATGPFCDQCKANTFTLAKSNQFGCIKCFCMGVTSTCSASNWFRNEIGVSFTNSVNNFSIIESTHHNARSIHENIELDSSSREIVYRDFPNRVAGNIYYWQLPSLFLGDKMVSYGGFLRYTVRYVPSPAGLSSKNNAPAVEILSAHDKKLLYYSQELPNPDKPTPFEVPLLEQYWQRTDGTPVDREMLLLALSNIEAVRIKATYTTHTALAALSQVSLDIAEKRNTGRERAVEVEECVCPAGYRGLSCEHCSTGYYKVAEGFYMSLCEPCSCNGHSNHCNAETGVCENCAHHTMGPNCELCEPGYTGNATRGTPYDCKYDLAALPIRCDCDERGSRSLRADCPCDCKRNVIGRRCDKCRDNTFGLSSNNPDGCNECFCSGLTDQCHESSLYWHEIPLLVYPEHGLILTDEKRREVIDRDFEVNIDENQLVYYYPQDRSSPRLFWSLPSTFTGNKVRSYSGSLAFTLKIETLPNAEITQDRDVILTGNGVTIFWTNPDPVQSGVPLEYNIVLRENVWHRLSREGHAPVSRADMMTVLSNLEAILVRATFSGQMVSTSINGIRMQTAGDIHNSFQQATQVEICRCPPGYSGTSCETCSRGYYRDIGDRSQSMLGACRRCPCNGKEESCEMDRRGQVVCHCSRGSGGTYCDEPEQQTVIPLPGGGSPKIRVQISEPEFQIVAIGTDVRYHCTGSSDYNNAVNVKWRKEGGQLPLDRTVDDNNGVLVIRELKVTDSGVYVCEVSDGINIGFKKVTLTVGGIGDVAPRVTINPSSIEVREGDPVEIQCQATGRPAPVLDWVRVHGTINPNSSFRNGVWRLPYAQKSDAAEYFCIARNNLGEHREATILYVRDGPRYQNPSNSLREPTITPSEWSGRERQTVRLLCSGPNMLEFVWSRLQGSLPEAARIQDGLLTIYNARTSDSGVYICTSTTAQNTKVSSKARVTIEPDKFSAVIKVTPERQTVSLGSTAEIHCADALKNNFSVVWSRSGNEPLRPNVVQDGETLRINNVQTADRGVYICTATRSEEIVTARATVDVDLRRPPSIEVYPQEVQSVLAGESVDIQCRVTEGYPTPEVVWSREDGRPLNRNVQQPSGGLLRIINVTLDNEGGFKCTAKNALGTVATVARVQVQAPPVVSFSPDPGNILKVQLDESVRIVCSATGRPAPNITWLKYDYDQGRLEPYNPQSEILVIDSVSNDDEGSYICEGKNSAGTNTKRIQIQIEDVDDNSITETPPCRGDITCSQPQILDPDYHSGRGNGSANDEYIIPEGENATIGCKVERNGGNKFLRVEWRWNDRALPRGIYQKGEDVIISKATKDVAGDYQCLGIDDYGSVVFKTVSTVLVVALPRITLYPPSQTVELGQNTQIQCIVEGDEPIEIEWFTKNGPLPESMQEYGVLTFERIKYEDAGRYVCRAMNKGGTAEAVAEVIVNESKDYKNIYAPQNNITTQAGNTVRLQCRTSGQKIFWSRQNNELPKSHRLGADYLELSRVHPSDSGRYICQVRDSQGEDSYDYIDLHVSASMPPVTIRSTSKYYNVGDTVDLVCQSHEISKPQFHWMREHNRPLPATSFVRGHTLTISSVEMNDGGRYICTVRDDRRSYEAVHNLIVQDSSYPGDAPAIDVKLVKQGDTAVLKCPGHMKDVELYEWARNEDLPVSSKIRNGTLIIDHVTEHDAGLYFCNSSNHMDRTEGPVILVATDVIPRFNKSDSFIEIKPIRRKIEKQLTLYINITLRPESNDGIVLYYDEHVNNTRRFFMLALEDGYPVMKFNLGSKTLTITSKKSIELNRWHTITCARDKTSGQLIVDEDFYYRGEVEDKNTELDLRHPLYIGGLPRHKKVHEDVSTRSSMRGCISKIKFNHAILNITADKISSHGITTCETCENVFCKHEGVCQQASNGVGYRCICRMGFYGDHCENVGETCYPGACGKGGVCKNTATGSTCYCHSSKQGRKCDENVNEPHLGNDKSYLAYKTPQNTRKLKFELSFKPDDDEDCVLMYCAETEEGPGDFIALVIKNKHVELRFDIGSGLAIVRSDYTIQAGSWTHAVITKDYRTGSISVNRETPVYGKSPGNARTTFLSTPLYVGGVDQMRIHLHRHTGAERGFRGCFSELILSNTDILKSPVETVEIENCSAETTSEPHNACLSSPCINGLCQPNLDFRDYSCMCNYGYVGRNCEKILKQCEMLSPCKNGGTCHDQHGSYRCDCRLGYDGMDCENLAKIEYEVSFRGDGWLEVDRSVMLHDEEKEVFGLEIATNKSNGLILWHGQNPDKLNPDDFVAVAVVDGYVEYQYNLGSGPAVIRVTAQRVDDGGRHRIVLKREGSDGSIELNGEHTESGMSDGLQQILNTRGNVFLGGVPDYAMTFKRYSEGFSGCIFSFEVGESRAIDLGTKAVRGKNVSPCSRRGRWNPSSLVFTDTDPDTFDAFVPPPPVNIIHPKPSAGTASPETSTVFTMTLLVLARIHRVVLN